MVASYNITGPQPAPEGIVRFWEHLRDAETLEHGKILRLAGGTSFLGDPSFRDTMMIRDCYRNLWAVVDAEFHRGQRGRVIVGTPGECCTVLPFKIST